VQLAATSGTAVTVSLIIAFAIGALEVWAVVDSVIRPDWVFQATGRRKPTWIILNVAGFFLCGLVPLFYLIAIRPKLKNVQTTADRPGAPPQPGWYPDPNGQPHMRFWNGHEWTDAIRPFGQ
jgi:hypothetical protein